MKEIYMEMIQREMEQMPLDEYLTLMHQQNIMETYEEDGPSSKRYSWLIDTEILEINQRLRMRKEEVKLLMASISM